MALGGLVLGSLILYLKGMRIMMFQLSGFYFKCNVTTEMTPEDSPWFQAAQAVVQGLRV